MKRLDNVRTALREAADALKAVATSEWGPSWTNVRGWSVDLEPLASRLRGLSRRLEVIEVGPGASICPLKIKTSACWLGQVCRGSEDKTCPLSRRTVVICRRGQCSKS